MEYNHVLLLRTMEELAKIARSGKIVTYEELCSKIDTDINPKDISHLLESISVKCSHLVMPLLPAIVVDHETNEPGDEFFLLYRELKGIQQGKENEVWQAECMKVWEFDKWDLLLAGMR